MDSRLDAIFKTQFRQTETLDTRQGIKRHERDDGRRKKRGNEDKKDDEDIWEDRPVISTRTLRRFLEQLVRNQDDSTAHGTEKISVSDTAKAREEKETNDPNRASTERAAKAAHAYQRTYRATHEEETTIPSAEALPAITLNVEDVRTISRLIKDLDQLAKNHVETITLEKSGGFLQSLVAAVTKAQKS